MFFSTSPSRALEARLEALASPTALMLLERYHEHLDERGLEHRELPSTTTTEPPSDSNTPDFNRAIRGERARRSRP